MNQTENLLSQFVAGDLATISILTFIQYFLLSGILAMIVAWFYRRYSHVVSDRRAFSNNFLIVAMTTMLVISIIKASLALSLGLVGALSIVRFRGAIKEPEELSFLFLAIAIGLGCGANQGSVTTIAVLVLLSAQYLRYKSLVGPSATSNIFLNISSEKGLNFEQVNDVLAKYFDAVKLQRYDVFGSSIEISYYCRVANVTALNNTKQELAKLDDSIRLTFQDN